MPTGRISDTEATWRTSLQEFGEYLRYRREKILRLNQAQVAIWAGIDQSRISRIENGGKPRDKATAVALAGAYRLTKAETKAWLDLLFGTTLVLELDGLVTRGEYLGEWLTRAYALLDRIGAILPSTHPHVYFDPDSADKISRLGPSFDIELCVVVDWILADSKHLPRVHLLVELATVLMHHLNERGQHRRRLALAIAAADAARELERRTVEGWLRSDAIPWTLMEHCHDPTSTLSHLYRGLALARELNNHDMEALAHALTARAELTNSQNRLAGNHLSQARRLDPSPPVKIRIDWIDGDLALRQKHYDKAFTLYQAAEKTDIGLGGGHHTVTPLFRQAELGLRLGDVSVAQENYDTLLSDMRPPLVGGRLARTLLGLARVARLKGETERARQLAEEAKLVSATADPDPLFRQIIDLFIASLPI